MSTSGSEASDHGGLERLCGVVGWVLIAGVALQRFLALIEMAGVTGGVPMFDRSGLTIFQVQPLEPFQVLIAALILAPGAIKGNPLHRTGLKVALVLSLLNVLAGLLVLIQGIRLDGHVQVPLQGRVNGIARGALTLRLTSQTIVPAVASGWLSLRSLALARRAVGQQPE